MHNISLSQNILGSGVVRTVKGVHPQETVSFIIKQNLSADENKFYFADKIQCT